MIRKSTRYADNPRSARTIRDDLIRLAKRDPVVRLKLAKYLQERGIVLDAYCTRK